jgi:hypothetical protein
MRCLRARQQEHDACDQNTEIVDVECADFSHDKAGDHEEGAQRDE